MNLTEIYNNIRPTFGRLKEGMVVKVKNIEYLPIEEDIAQIISIKKCDSEPYGDSCVRDILDIRNASSCNGYEIFVESLRRRKGYIYCATCYGRLYTIDDKIIIPKKE